MIRRSEDGASALEARLAVFGYAPSAGDRVLATAGSRGAYVTGVLMAAGHPPQLSSGDANVRLEDGQFVLRGADGTVLLRHDPESGITKVSTEHTVLCLEASERLELKAKEVVVEAERLVHRAAEVVTEADRVAVSADRWELRANRIHERAKNVFRDVESLLQVRTGTLRHIARKGMTLFAKHTSIRSKEDTAVDGKRVLLG